MLYRRQVLKQKGIRVIHTNLTTEELRAAQEARRKQLDRLTQQAKGGDFKAFRERQRLLSRDPVDLGLEWEQFQQAKQNPHQAG